MRILGRKFYAYKSKNRRKNTPDSAFPRTLANSVDADETSHYKKAGSGSTLFIQAFLSQNLGLLR